jgi:hypothetical protein
MPAPERKGVRLLRSIESGALSPDSGGRRKIPRRAWRSAASVTSAASGARAPVARLRAKQAPPLWRTGAGRGVASGGAAQPKAAGRRF